MTTDLSDGFEEDCKNFLTHFMRHNSVDFDYFAAAWNELNFQDIFIPRSSPDELNCFVEEALIIVKRLFLQANDMREKCCFLYLMYAIFYKQPEPEAAHVRITLQEWPNFKEFYDKLNDEIYFTTVGIFLKLAEDDAFHFVHMEQRYCLDPSFNRQPTRREEKPAEDDDSFKPASKTVLKELDTMQDSKHGLITALDIVEAAYNEMKDSLCSSDNQPLLNKESLPPSNLAKEIQSVFDNVNEIFTYVPQTKAARRKERRRKKQAEHDVSGIDSSDSETARGGGSEKSPSIKSKRKALKEKAFKADTPKRKSVLDRPSTSQEDRVSSAGTPEKKRRSRGIVDQKHFKKVTMVQQIFEHNMLRSDDEEKQQQRTAVTKLEPVD